MSGVIGTAFSKVWALVKKLTSASFKGVRKVLKTVAHPIKTFTKWVSKTFIYGKQSLARRVLATFVMYVLGMFPGTIATTAISTASFTNFNLPAVYSVMQQRGFTNYLTYGLSGFSASSLQSAWGSLVKQFGEFTNNDKTIQAGQDFINKGTDYVSAATYGLDGIDLSTLEWPEFRWPWESADLSVIADAREAAGLEVGNVADGAKTWVESVSDSVTNGIANGVSSLTDMLFQDQGQSQNQGQTQTQQLSDSVYVVWDESLAPNYVLKVSDTATMDVKVDTGTIQYSDFDELGRTGRAVGMLTYSMVEDSAGERSTFETGAEPSGWPEKNTYVGQKEGQNGLGNGIAFQSGKVYRGYFWNRSHLIADALGGYVYDDFGNQVSQRRNLITGTRAQNVGDNSGEGGGMLYCENLAREWLTNNQSRRLWYSAEPIYIGDELIPRSVVVKMLSDDGTLQGVWIVYNCAKGYIIDYHTGEIAVQTK